MVCQGRTEILSPNDGARFSPGDMVDVTFRVSNLGDVYCLTTDSQLQVELSGERITSPLPRGLGAEPQTHTLSLRIPDGETGTLRVRATLICTCGEGVSHSSFDDVFIISEGVAPGIISVTSAPITASVYWNDEFQGYSPVAWETPPQTGVLRLELAGYEDHSETITVPIGGVIEKFIFLTPVVMLPVDIRVDAVSVNKSFVGPGESVMVTAIISNHGGSYGAERITVEVDGVYWTEGTAAVFPGQSTEGSWTVYSSVSGWHDVCVEDKCVSFEVKPVRGPLPCTMTDPVATPTMAGVGDIVTVKATLMDADGVDVTSYGDPRYLEFVDESNPPGQPVQGPLAEIWVRYRWKAVPPPPGSTTIQIGPRGDGCDFIESVGVYCEEEPAQPIIYSLTGEQVGKTVTLTAIVGNAMDLYPSFYLGLADPDYMIETGYGAGMVTDSPLPLVNVGTNEVVTLTQTYKIIEELSPRVQVFDPVKIGFALRYPEGNTVTDKWGDMGVINPYYQPTPTKKTEYTNYILAGGTLLGLGVLYSLRGKGYEGVG